MTRIIAILALAAALFTGPAMADLTPTQRATFAAAINAETAPALVACRTIRDDGCIAAWYNTATATAAWRESVPASDLFELMNLTTFDARTAGQRQAWDIFLRYAPINMSRNKMRAAVNDIWLAADRDAILTGCTEPATRFELVFGGSNATTGNVTALKRNLLGPVSVSDVSAALNP